MNLRCLLSLYLFAASFSIAGCSRGETNSAGDSTQSPLLLDVRTAADASLAEKHLLLQGEPSVLFFYVDRSTAERDLRSEVTETCRSNGVWLATVPIDYEPGRQIGSFVGIKRVPAVLVVHAKGDRTVAYGRDGIRAALRGTPSIDPAK